jgi:hypothetical protein
LTVPGCLIVFNSSKLSGGSPQIEKKYICNKLDQGSFLYYILFPRTDVDLNEYVVECAGTIDLDSNSNFNIEMGISRLLFVLNSSFEVKDVIFSHRFLDKHRRLKDENKITSTLDDNYRNDLIKNVLYWDGQNWGSTPTMTSYWEKSSIQ